MIRRIRPANPRRSASIRWPTHSLALHSPGAGRQPAAAPRPAISALTVVVGRGQQVGDGRQVERRKGLGIGRERVVHEATSGRRGAGRLPGGVALTVAIGSALPADAAPGSASQHAADWPPPTSNSGGSSTRHRSNTCGQRGWKRHPFGMCAASGVSPTRIVRRARVPSVGGSGRRRDRDQRLRVGVARRSDHRLRRPDLHDLAEVHHGDPVGDDPGERQVMGDEQVREPAFAPQVEHQPQQLGPDRDVEHRDRLVRHDELRVHHQGAGDDHALALPARELVRIAEGVVPRQPGRLQRRLDACLAVGRIRGQPVDLERLGDEVVDRLLRVERLVRVLEDDLDASPVRAERRVPHRVETSAPSNADRARRLAGELDDDPAGRRLAGPGFADQGQDLALGEREVDPVDRPDDARWRPRRTASSRPDRIGKWTSRPVRSRSVMPWRSGQLPRPIPSRRRRRRRRPRCGGHVGRAHQLAALAPRRVEVARDPDAVREEDLRRHDLLADGHHERAARMEPAARRRIAEVRRLPGDRVQPAAVGVDARERAEQLLRVRMPRAP